MFNYKKIAVLLCALLIFDYLWISQILLTPFSNMIQQVQGGSPMVFRPIGGIVAYVALFILAYLFLPKTDSYFEAFILGFMVYAVYDGTNYATLINWDAKVAIADSLWGGVLFIILKHVLLYMGV